MTQCYVVKFPVGSEWATRRDGEAAKWRPIKARANYEKALQLAKTIEPDFQIRSVPGIGRRLQAITKSQ